MPLGLDCGPACRIALNGPISHSEWPPTQSTEFVVDSGHPTPDTYALYFAQVGSNNTQLFPTGVMPGLFGHTLSYVSGAGLPGDIVVYDMDKGILTPYLHFDDNRTFGVLGTMISNKYVFWGWAGGIGKANLQTGEIGNLIPQRLQCDAVCFHDNDLVCGDNGNRIFLIDQDTGNARLLDDGGAIQEWSNCRADAQQIVWIDYRDPPGTSTTADGHHEGGEVYLHDFGTGQTTRLTHDSPNTPSPKANPAVSTDIAIWFERCEGCSTSYASLGEYWGAMTTLVRMDLSSGQRCRIPKSPYLSWSALHGHHLYTYWVSPDPDRQDYLVDVDLDNPALSWQCDPPSGDGG